MHPSHSPPPVLARAAAAFLAAARPCSIPGGQCLPAFCPRCRYPHPPYLCFFSLHVLLRQHPQHCVTRVPPRSLNIGQACLARADLRRTPHNSYFALATGHLLPVCPAPCVVVHHLLHTLFPGPPPCLAAVACPASSVGLHISAIVLFRTSHRPDIDGCCQPSPGVQPQPRTSCKTMHASTDLACSGPPETSFSSVAGSESLAFASPTLGL